MNQSPKTPSSAGTGGLSKGRIEAFSDGVFAIVITLLVFNIKVPELPRGAPAAELRHALLELWPKFLSYVISVVVVGIYWVAHHAAFHCVKHSDRIFLWINILFLAFVAVIPFSAALLGQYHRYQIAIVFYGANMIAAGLSLYLLWWYATSKHRCGQRHRPPPDTWRKIQDSDRIRRLFIIHCSVVFQREIESHHLYTATCALHFARPGRPLLESYPKAPSLRA